MPPSSGPECPGKVMFALFTVFLSIMKAFPEGFGLISHITTETSIRNEKKEE